MTWPAFVLWAMIIVAALMRGPLGLFYLFFACGTIGTLVMVPGNLVGGVNLLPQSFCALLFLAKIMLLPGAPGRAVLLAFNLRELGFLTLFLVWSLFTAYAMPRFFAGHVDVIPINALLPDPQPLGPNSANLTQSAYMILTVGLIYFCAIIARTSEFQRHFLRANLIAGVLLILTGLLDLATQGTELLAPFRNANYALLTDVEILGSKRVVGLMPEASTYGSACVGILSVLLFLRPSFEAKLRRLAVPATIFGLIIMTVLSTSSTGYVGLAILGGTYVLSLFWRLQSRNSVNRRGIFTEFAILAFVAICLMMIVLTHASLLNPLVDLINLLVFQKTESSSYIERAGWTRYAWQAFLATNGWGVGLGSARASNWYYVILGNTGLIGAFLLGIFLIQCFLRRPASDDSSQSSLSTGLKFSMIPNLVMAGLSGTTPDPGAQSGVTFGVITGLSLTSGSAYSAVEEDDERIMQPGG